MILHNGYISEAELEELECIYAHTEKEFNDWVKPLLEPRIKNNLPKGSRFILRDVAWFITCNVGLRVMVSGSTEEDGDRWIHISFSRANRLPSWLEMVKLKECILPPEFSAIQVIPPREQYINDHKFCLHLWSNIDKPNLLPDFRRRVAGRLSI